MGLSKVISTFTGVMSNHKYSYQIYITLVTKSREPLSKLLQGYPYLIYKRV